MLTCEIDHLVLIAPSLASGAEYIRHTLGVTPQPGGEHQRMGTHNCLIKLGESTYLEVIAVNPEAARPSRPRWFEMDSPDADSGPRLATWVARVNDLEAALDASPIHLGEIEAMSRGQLNWRITIPPDGGLPLQGVAPTLIQWAAAPHPASLLKDCGCSLLNLQGFHPAAGKIDEFLESVGFQGLFSVSPLPAQQKPYLTATFATPDGIRRLGMG